MAAADVCPQYLMLSLHYGGDSNSPSAVAKTAPAEPPLRTPCACGRSHPALTLRCRSGGSAACRSWITSPYPPGSRLHRPF